MCSLLSFCVCFCFSSSSFASAKSSVWNVLSQVNSHCLLSTYMHPADTSHEVGLADSVAVTHAVKTAAGTQQCLWCKRQGDAANWI